MLNLVAHTWQIELFWGNRSRAKGGDFSASSTSQSGSIWSQIVCRVVIVINKMIYGSHAWRAHISALDQERKAIGPARPMRQLLRAGCNLCTRPSLACGEGDQQDLFLSVHTLKRVPSRFSARFHCNGFLGKF